MWNLTEEQYKASVLGPAAMRFDETGELPDVFHRFGLAPDVDDERDIRTAIEAVRSIWARQQHRNPKYEALLARLTLKTENNHAEAVLLDRRRRRQARVEVEQAHAQRQAKIFEDLDLDIAAASDERGIDAQAFAKLCAKWTKRGTTEDAIRQRLRVPIVHNKKRRRRLAEEGELAFNKREREKITSCLRILGHADIRGFLDVARGADAAAVTLAMRKARALWDTKPPDGIKTAANHLLAVLNANCATGELAPFDRWNDWEALQRLKVDISLFSADKRVSLNGFRLLTQRGMAYGIPEARAKDVIEDLAQQEGFTVEIPAALDTACCSHCGTANELSADVCVNASCRRPLKVPCHGCGLRIGVSSGPCRHCGLDASVLPRLQHALEAAQRDATAKNRVAAQQHMAVARGLWANIVTHQPYRDLEQQLSTLDKELTDLLARIQKHVSAREYVSAQQILAAGRSYGLADATIGTRPVERVAMEVDQAVQAATDLVREAKRLEASGQKAGVRDVYRQALAICADSAAARVGLAECLPQAPAAVTAAHVTGQVAIKVDWMPTSDPNVTYEVRRGTGRPVLSSDAGQLIAQTAGTHAIDTTVEFGCLYFYSVFAVAGGLASPAATSDSLLLHGTVSDLVIKAGNAVVTGSWNWKAASGSLEVLRRDAGLLKAFSERKSIACTDAGFEDRSVVNGTTYEYNVLVTYPMPDAKPIVRESGWIQAQPKPAFSFGVVGCLLLFILMGFVVFVMAGAAAVAVLTP
jgi:hypothetical protein